MTYSEKSFAERLGDLLESNGLTTSKLAVMSGLGRTSITNILSGHYKPSRAFVVQLLRCFPLSPDERDTMCELYMKEKVGEQTYRLRSIVREICEDLHLTYMDDLISSVNTPELCDAAADNYQGLTELMIKALVRELEKDQPRIITTIPFDSKGAVRFISNRAAKCGKGAHIIHIGRLVRDKDAEDNLRLIQLCLSLSLCQNISFDPYFYYVDSMTYDSYFPPYMYYLATSEAVVLVNREISSGFMTISPNVHRQIMAHSKRLMANSKKLFELYNDTQALELFFTSAPVLNSAVQFQPSLTQELDEKLVASHIRNELRTPELMNRIGQSFFASDIRSAVEKQNSVINIFYCREGLENFARTGRLMSIPGWALEEFSPAERLYMINALKKRTRMRLIDQERLKMPSGTDIMYFGDETVIISVCEGDYKRAFVINDRFTVNAFADFIESLDEHGMLLSTEETEEIIDEICRTCFADLM